MKHYWMWLLRAPEEGTGAGDGGKESDEGNGGVDDGGSAASAAAGDDGGSSDGNDGPADGSKTGKASGKSSIYDDVGLEEPGAEGSATWPEDWRTQMANGDDKFLKRLERYSSPDQVGKALSAAQQRISSGEYKRVALAEDATEEQVKEWREEQGIPADAKEYELPVTLDGELADMDDGQKAVYESWQSTFHELNIPQETAASLTKHGNAIVEAHLEAQAEADAKHLDAFDDSMRAEWGSEFRVNGKMNVRYLNDTLGGDEATQSLMNSRMPNGMLLKNDPAFTKMINAAARSSGITGNMETGEPSGMTDKASRKAEIEEIQRTGEYTPALRKEYGDILSAMEGKGEIGV